MCANVEVKKVCQIAGAQASSGPKGPEPRHRFSPGGPQPAPAISRSQRGLYSFGDDNNAGTKSDNAGGRCMQRKWGGGAREWCSVDDVYGSPYTHGLPMKLAGLAVVRRALISAISWQYMIAMINTSLPAGARARVKRCAMGCYEPRPVWTSRTTYARRFPVTSTPCHVCHYSYYYIVYLLL